MIWRLSLRGNYTGEEGFSLIEVLMALSIFAIGILALAGLQAQYIGGNSAAAMQTEATAMAAQYLEWLRTLPDAHSDLQAGVTHRERSGAYTVEWSVHENDTPPGTKFLHVTVTPDNPRSRRAVRLSTMIAADP